MDEREEFQLTKLIDDDIEFGLDYVEIEDGENAEAFLSVTFFITIGCEYLDIDNSYYDKEDTEYVVKSYIQSKEKHQFEQESDIGAIDIGKNLTTIMLNQNGYTFMVFIWMYFCYWCSIKHSPERGTYNSKMKIVYSWTCKENSSFELISKDVACYSPIFYSR